MIDLLIQMALSNVFISLVLAIAAAIVGTTLKRPLITHLLWLLVFVKLLTPPVLTVHTIPVPWMEDISLPVSLDTNEKQEMQSIGVSESPGNAFVSKEKEPVALEQGKPLLFIVWVLGSTVVFFWSLFQVYRFHRLLKRESEIGSPKIQSIAKEIGSCLGIKAVPTIHTTSAKISPMVWWIGGKVWVVIPSVLIEQMDAEKLRWILSHELAHVRRRDYIVRWIEWLACVCFWWNPVTWWARYNLRANEELCCDALVLSSMKPKLYVYGDSLLKAIEILACPAHRPLVIASGINNGNLLERRVKMIVSNHLSKSTLRWLQVWIMLGALMVLPLGLTKAQDNNKDKPHKTESPYPIELEEMADSIYEIQMAMDDEEISQDEGIAKLQELYNGILSRKPEIDSLISLIQAGEISEEEAEVKLTDFEQDLITMQQEIITSVNRILEAIIAGEISGPTACVMLLEVSGGLHQIQELRQTELKQSLEQIQKYRIMKRDIPLLLSQITATISDAGLDVRVFEPGAVITKDGYSETPVHMEVTGRYKNIMRTIDAIKRIERFVTFRDLELNSDEKDAVVKMSMTIVAYHL